MLSILSKRRAPTILMTGGSSEVCRASERKMVVELSQPEGVKRCVAQWNPRPERDH